MVDWRDKTATKLRLEERTWVGPYLSGDFQFAADTNRAVTPMPDGQEKYAAKLTLGEIKGQKFVHESSTTGYQHWDVLNLTVTASAVKRVQSVSGILNLKNGMRLTDVHLR